MTGRVITRATLELVLAKALGELDLSERTQGAFPMALVSRAGAAMPVRVIAIGKAAPAMAAGALAHWGSAVESCLVVAPDGTDTKAVVRAASRSGSATRVTVLRASHPLPDLRSVAAAQACLDAVICRGDRLIVVLVSGGASALVCAPIAGITLGTKRAITRAMLKSGASVQALNVVRKHLSRIKGGGLARAAAPNRVITIVASDVIGGAASEVGSGPSLADATTIAAARRLLRRHAPSFAQVPLVKTSGDPTIAGRTRAKIVASPEELARVVGRSLRETFRGLDVRVLPPSQSSVEQLASDYVELARRCSRPSVFVRAAEPSLVVAARAGKGGRCTHLAALVGRALADATRGGVVRYALFGAFATDGVDGRSGTAGAVVGARFATDAARRLGPLAIDQSIADFDTGTLHHAMNTARASRPTGHNLADVHLLVVSRP